MLGKKMAVKSKKKLSEAVLSLEIKSEKGNQYQLNTVNPSPCNVACPAGVNVKSYLGLIGAGKFDEALAVVKRTNPLPGICGRVCTHPCEGDCYRKTVDEAVSICALKRFIADYELRNRRTKKVEKLKQTRHERVAVVGSGPAGLTLANDLIRKGYGVNIFEALPVAGGMLSVGIPSYRLPRDVINAEIDSITNLGVEIKTNTRLGEDFTLADLFNQGFHAVFLAIGAHKSLLLGIPGEGEYEGFVDCIEFLRRVNLGEKYLPGKNVIVIGGGNSAIDAARTAARLGADKVHVVYRRSRKEMPASELEIEDAEEEGVNFHYLAAPKKVFGEGGKVTGIECVRMKLGEPDDSGRRRPIPVKGSEFIIKTDTVIPAISQQPDISAFPKDSVLKFSKWNTIEAKPDTLATNIDGVYAGGDAVTGPRTVIEAIQAGHNAAAAIHNYLSGESLEKNDTLGLTAEIPLQISAVEHEHLTRFHPPKLDSKSRLATFAEVDLTFPKEMAIKEANRCLRCGPCAECEICVPECNRRLVVLSSTTEGEGSSEVLLSVPANQNHFQLQEHLKGHISDSEEEAGRGSSKRAVEVVLMNNYVLEEFCVGCGDCVKICNYGAPSLHKLGKDSFASRINGELCKGCGSCSANCPSSAIVARYFTDKWVEEKLDKILSQWE